MILAFVLLSKASAPKGEEILRNFSLFAGPEERIQMREDDNAMLEFEVTPAGSAFVAMMPFPVPNEEADDAVRFSISALGSGWKLPAHEAHLVVSLRDVESKPVAVSLSCFTSLVAAVIKGSPAVGVYWGGAGATHDPEFFMATARNDDVPRIMLWTGVSMAREPDERLSLLSLGMNQLNLPDLLLIAPTSAASDVMATFFDFLDYIAQLGEPIQEGHSIGCSVTERLPVHYLPSPIDPAAKVWCVELE